MNRYVGCFLLSLLTLLFLFPLQVQAQSERDKKIKYVVSKKGAKISVIDILTNLNYQFGGEKIILPHPTVLNTPPITFHTTMELSYEEVKAILDINGIELIESKVNGTTMITAYSDSSLPSLRTGPTEFLSPGEKIPENVTLVTQAFRIQHIDANVLYSMLRSMIFQDPKRVGNIFYVRGSNSIILRDFKENVRYYARIIKSLDKKQEDISFKIIRLKNASAEDVSRLATQLINVRKQAGGNKGQNQNQAQVVGDKRTNKVVIMAPKSQIGEYIKMVQELDEKVDESATGQFHVIKLKNLQAEDVAPKLNEILTGQESVAQSSGGQGRQGNPARQKLPTRIVAEPKRNALIIQAEPEDYRKIVRLLEDLDIAPPQVLIETHIFEVEASRTLNIGAELATISPSVPDSYRGAGLTNFGLSQLNIDPSSPNRIGRIPNPSQGVVAAIHKGGFDRLPLLVNLLGTDRKTNILAEPFAVTNNNEEAIFKDETEIPTIQTASTASDANLITQQGSETASTTLKIKPHISPGDYLRLDIDLQLEDFAAQGSAGNTTPPKTRRSYKGSVTVKNGKFIVIGGLTRNDFTETINKVPLLGDIPLLGYLFSNRQKQERQVNIYIFIRAYILPKDSDRASRVTKYWKDKAMKASDQEFRENYGADLSKRQIMKKVRGMLAPPGDNMLGNGESKED